MYARIQATSLTHEVLFSECHYNIIFHDYTYKLGLLTEICQLSRLVCQMQSENENRFKDYRCILSDSFFSQIIIISINIDKCYNNESRTSLFINGYETETFLQDQHFLKEKQNRKCKRNLSVISLLSLRFIFIWIY